MGKSKVSRAELTEMVFKDGDVQEYGISRKEVGVVVAKFISVLRDAIENLPVEGTIELRGFGTFGVKLRKPRLARNPKTGDPVEVGARKSVFFKPGRDLKNSVRGED